MRKISLNLLLLAFLLTACGSEGALPTRFPTAGPASLAPPPTPPVTAVSAPLPTPLLPTSTPLPTAAATADFLLGAADGVPAELVEAAFQTTLQNPGLLGWSEGGSEGEENVATLALSGGMPLASWVYAVAAPFATLADDVTFQEVADGWSSGSAPLGHLVVDSDTASTLSVLWGPPSPAVHVVEPEALIDTLWATRPSWSIVPFHRLSPELKVLALDGQSPLDHNFEALAYPLVARIGISGDGAAAAQLRALWSGPGGNRDPGRLSRVAMTGVTALSRATAYQMEIQGITTPGTVVGPVLQAADIAHLSHEVAFAPDCPYPDPNSDPIFCARDGYLALIESIGTDVVELTGNHVNDWGPPNLDHTIDLYEAAGMKTFGGGRNLSDAQDPAIFEHNGNKIAFVGCNPVGPAGAWAAEGRAGSLPCDYAAFFARIRGLRDSGHLVIATLQYSEFYHYVATAEQQADFRAVADSGAAAVSGSQGHHAQAFDYHNGAFIHYGLGNLFFDQMDMLGTRQSFVDTYVVYDGRLLSVELFTSLIENYCCPRAMTGEERDQLLQSVFQASGW
jgi:poly-gamma-glutamate synthesis protein (capsule biosynthesis protein)